jgi:nucleoid-associated protein YgaU
MKNIPEDDLEPKKKPEKPDAREGKLAGSKDDYEEMMRRRGKRQLKEEKEYTYIATHTVESGDTLSGLAKKFYGSEAQAYWMEIYEANKEVIGDNPNVILIGQVLNIPEKPEL